MSVSAPYPLQDVIVPRDWVDFNGHMNDAAYAAAFSDAIMVMTDKLGLDAVGRERTGHTIYTVAMMIRYLHEAAEGAPLSMTGRVIEADEKRLRVWAEMYHGASGTLLATTEQLFLCVDQSGSEPRAAPWPEPFATRLKDLAAAHATLPLPEGAGDGIRLKRRMAPAEGT